MKYFISLFFPTLLICSCQKTESINQIVEKNVRTYFFMNDSINIQAKITDTIYSNDLLEIENELDKNINKIQQQIDTLDLYINLWETKMFELMDKNADECEIKNAKLLTYTYQLNQMEYKLKLNQLLSNRRINLGLKRTAHDTIMAYETEVIYYINNQNDTLKVLMNADYKIID